MSYLLALFVVIALVAVGIQYSFYLSHKSEIKTKLDGTAEDKSRL